MSTRLRTETREAHERAEHAPLFSAIFNETCPPQAMLDLHRGFLDVYKAMEAGLTAHKDHPVVGAFYLPELFRVAAIEQDLQTLAPDLMASPAVDAARSYATHLQMLAADEPLRLVAHAYTRYLGDLSGGQMLAKKAKAIVGEDLAFYEFPLIKNPGAAKTDFRKRLDAMDLTEEQADAVVAEASVAFELNTELAIAVWPG